MDHIDTIAVSNIRNRYGPKVASYSDAEIMETWKIFSQSDDYAKDRHLFLEWLKDVRNASGYIKD